MDLSMYELEFRGVFALLFCHEGRFYIHIFLGAFWGGLDVPDGTSVLMYLMTHLT